MIRFAVLCALIVASACSVPDQASCDHRPTEQTCSDLLENKDSQLQSTLEGLCVGTYSDDLCDRTGALGGCQCDSCETGKSITWMYPDPENDINTAADVMEACGSKVFVSP